MDIFGTLIARPFGWVFWAILQLINNYGVAIVIFSLIVKIILYPLQYKSKKGMLAQMRLQPKIKDIEARYKNDRTAYNTELQKLYSENGISPMSGCLPMLLLFPIMIGLYRVIRQPLTYVFGLSSEKLTELATEVGGKSSDEIAVIGKLAENSEYFINMKFLGLDLTAIPKFGLNWLVILPIVSGASALLMSLITQKLQEKLTGVSAQTNGSTKSLLYTMPLFSVFLGFTIPAGLTVYWIANNLWGIVQEYILNFQMKGLMQRQEEKEMAQKAATREIREEAVERNRELQRSGAAANKKKIESKKYKLSRPTRRNDDDDDE